MLIEIFSYDFMQRAIMAVIATNISALILGIFLILRHQSLMSSMFSRASLADAALGISLGTSTTWSTILVVTIAAVILEYSQMVYKHYVEIPIAILMSLGLAISLIATNRSENGSSVNLNQYLFGSIITIDMGQVVALSIIAVVVVPLTILFIRSMHILTSDEETAFVDGLPVCLMSILFNTATGIAIALTIPVAGASSVSTIMVLLASIAMCLGKNFKSVILTGVIAGLIDMIAGIITSYYWETPASATITVILVRIFLLVNLFNMISYRNS